MSTRSSEVAERIRRTMLDMSLRRQRPGNGSHSLQPDETYRMTWPNLNDVLLSVPWAVAGGVATRRYMPERSTQDLDVVILQRDRAEAESLLAASGYTREGALSIDGSTWRSPDGVPVDLILLSESWAERAIEQASANKDNDGLPVLPLPYLIMLKMFAIRPQDIADVHRMLAAASPAAREEVRESIEEFAPGLLDDYDSTIVLAEFLANQPE